MTKQELQQKIYKAGFKPPLWTDGTELYSNGTIIPTGNIDYELDLPHYPCEWLWERLPKEIDNKDYLRTQVGKRCYLGIQTDDDGVNLGIGYVCYEYNSFNYHIPINNDLHQALLELFVWAITGGHIKA